MTSRYGDTEADRLIREVSRTRRAATSQEVEQIVECMATAPFASVIVKVPVEERGVQYRGITLA